MHGGLSPCFDSYARSDPHNRAQSRDSEQGGLRSGLVRSGGRRDVDHKPARCLLALWFTSHARVHAPQRPGAHLPRPSTCAPRHDILMGKKLQYYCSSSNVHQLQHSNPMLMESQHQQQQQQRHDATGSSGGAAANQRVGLSLSLSRTEAFKE